MDRGVSELFDVQTELDTGLGLLRSEVAAAREVSDGSSLGPLRNDVKALQEQITTLNEALVALKRSVESLRRTTSRGATLGRR